MSDIERSSQFCVISQQEKYTTAFVVAPKIVSVASEIPTRNFASALQCMQQIVSAWQGGKHIIVQPYDPSMCDPSMPPERPPGPHCHGSSIKRSANHLATLILVK